MQASLKTAARDRMRAQKIADRSAKKIESANRNRARMIERRDRRILARRRRARVMRTTFNVVGAVGAAAFAFLFCGAINPGALAQQPQMLMAMHLLTVNPISLQQAAVPTPLAQTSIAPPNPDDVHLLAATAWAEARGEGEEGMRAVAHVVVNRIGARFGDDLHDVVLSPKQFSSWNLNDPNRPLALHPERYARAGINATTWAEAQEVAREVLMGQSQDPTNGALFYHAAAIKPWWARFGIGKHQIGAHVFYENVPDRRA